MSDVTTDPSTTPVAPISQTPESRPPWLVVGLVGLGVLLLGWWGWKSFGPKPALEPAMSLYSSSRYQEAEPKLAEFLAHEPDNQNVRLALADTLMSIEPAKPAEALKHLEVFKSRNGRQSAAAHVVRGKAYQALDQTAKAEAEWKTALKRDPLVGEAGFLLLQLYYIEGRSDELRALALKLHKTEPEPHDRVKLLLEPMRADAEPLAAAGVIPALKNAVKNDPDDVHAALAYYRAMAKDGTGIDEALQGLRALAQKHPTDVACLDGLMSALAQVDMEGLAKALAAPPKEIAADPRLAKYRGAIAENRREYPTAIAVYKAALEADPSNREILYRLAETYKLAGQAKESDDTKARLADLDAARDELRGIKGREVREGQIGLFEDAISRPNFGRNPDPTLYKKLANVRERMGHPDEALAWYALVQKELPDDAESRQAVERLQKSAANRPQ